MISKIIGSAAMSGMMRKLRGGPQSMLPKSPGKGYGTPSFKGLTTKRNKQYATPSQNPNRSPRTGGLPSAWRLK